MRNICVLCNIFVIEKMKDMLENIISQESIGSIKEIVGKGRSFVITVHFHFSSSPISYARIIA